MSDVSKRKEKTAAGGARPGHGEEADERSGLLGLALLSLIAGAVTGLVGALFRLSLDRADQFRGVFVARAHQWGVAGIVLVTAACAIATAVAAWLVRRFAPHASGSGIPHVEAVLRVELPPAPFTLVPVKFAGGVLAIGSGLALGREGPSVQLGATLSHLVGVVFRRNWADYRALLAAGAGAGLAAAFNAPIAGAVFVLEELVRCFETRITVAALGASATAIFVSRLFLGDVPDFAVDPLAFAGPQKTVLFFLLGVVAGFLAVAYNRTLLGSLALANRLRRWPVEVRAGLIGAAVGVVAWFLPNLVGGGQEVTQRTLAGEATLAALPLVFLLRFGLACVSYAARTPGGLFAPMLVLGAQFGLFFGMLCRLTFPDLEVQPVAFAVVGMAAFFTGSVRAPVTGIVLIIEMTGSFRMLLPMLAACFTAMLVPTLLGNPPIYDSLRER
jgi:CIC family chloride channel protein